jgi:hypothetical protein
VVVTSPHLAMEGSVRPLSDQQSVPVRRRVDLMASNELTCIIEEVHPILRLLGRLGCNERPAGIRVTAEPPSLTDIRGRSHPSPVSQSRRHKCGGAAEEVLCCPRTPARFATVSIWGGATSLAGERCHGRPARTGSPLYIEGPDERGCVRAHGTSSRDPWTQNLGPAPKVAEVLS